MTKTKWPALESVFSELTDAIARKKFTKARRLAAQIDFNVVMAFVGKSITTKESDAYHARISVLRESIPAKPPRTTERQRQAAFKQRMMTESKSDYYPAK